MTSLIFRWKLRVKKIKNDFWKSKSEVYHEGEKKGWFWLNLRVLGALSKLKLARISLDSWNSLTLSNECLWSTKWHPSDLFICFFPLSKLTSLKQKLPFHSFRAICYTAVWEKSPSFSGWNSLTRVFHTHRLSGDSPGAEGYSS